jgi:hypothetical protein
MKAKRIVTGLALAVAVAVGLGLPEAASADRGGGSRGGGKNWSGHSHFRGGGFHGHGGKVFVGHRHSRSSFGVVVGVPFYWGAPYYPYYYPPYYYPPYGYPAYGYYPPAAASSPPVYVEKGAQGEAPGGSDYWYYCEQSQAYYPYVKECPGGWKREVPRPPPGQ